MGKKNEDTALKVTMTKDRDTKGTYVYKSDADNTPIRSLYITKSAVDGDAPAEITISIEGMTGKA